MTLKLLMEVSPQELLESLAELQNHVLGYVKSTSLKCAVDLGIPAAIHKRGGTATLADIAADAKVHPAKVADLRRMMALLSASGIFTTTAAAGAGDDGGATDDTAAVQYGLTTTGRFLVGRRCVPLRAGARLLPAGDGGQGRRVRRRPQRRHDRRQRALPGSHYC